MAEERTETGNGEAAATFTMPSDREIVITRVFDAPRRLVFEAWTRPEHVARWWGPRRFTISVCKIDLRPGGAYRFVQRGPDGKDYPFKGVYREIVPPERLVYTQCFDVEPWASHEALVTVTFAEQDGKTKLTSTIRFQTVEDRDANIKMGMKEGMAETLDRLAEHLGSMALDAAPPSDREIVITRVFDAPRELVFKAWTDPEHVGRWWGPKGFTTTTHEMDVRPGGVWRFIMHGPDGVDYKNQIVYIEVVKPERLVYSHGGDEEGESGQFHVTVTFAEHGGKTYLTMRMRFESAAERDKAVKEIGAIEGAHSTLDRLEEHLAAM